MDSLGFPTIGRTFKLVVDAFGITFGKKSFLTVYYNNSNIDVGNLSRQINSLMKEKQLKLPELDLLMEQIFSPIIDEVIGMIHFPEIIEEYHIKKIKVELFHPLRIFLKLYKSLILQYPGDRRKLLFYCIDKIALYYNYVEINPHLKLLKSPIKIKNFLEDAIIKDDYFTPVYEWWIESSNLNSIRNIATSIQGENESLYNELLRWKNLEHLPDLETLLRLVENLPECVKGIDSVQFRANLFLKLLLSRFFSYLKLNFECLLDKEELNRQYKRRRDSTSAFTLEEMDTEVATFYTDDSFYSVSDDLIFFYEKAKRDIFLDLEKARFWVYRKYTNPEIAPKNATEYYIKAFEKSSYKMGTLTRDIIEEIIVVAALFDDVKLLKKVYLWARNYDLFFEPFEDIKNWVLWFYKLFFFKYFSPQEFGSPVSQELMWDAHEDVKKFNIYDEYSPKYYKWKDEDVKKTANELNTLHSYFYLSFTQLMKFCIAGSFRKVEQAISSGARIDLINEDNGTALYYSLLYGHFNIAIMLLRSGKNLEINRMTHKDKHSYFDALLGGLIKNQSEESIEIVYLLLGEYFDINIESTLYDRTVIYSVINNIVTDLSKKVSLTDSTQHLAMRDFSSLNKVEYITGDEKSYAYKDDIEGVDEKSFIHLKNRLDPIFLKIFNIVIQQENINCDIVSGTGLTPLLYLSRFSYFDLFKMVFDKTKDKYFVITGIDFNNCESILKNCIQNKSWETLEFYLASIDISKLEKEDKYLPFYVCILFETYITEPKNKFLKNILIKLGTYFLHIIVIVYFSNIQEDVPGIMTNPDMLVSFAKCKEYNNMILNNIRAIPEEDFYDIIESLHVTKF